MRISWLCVGMLGCWRQESGIDEPGLAPKGPGITVELAGVTLAENCADGALTRPTRPPPVAAKPTAESTTPGPAAKIAPGASMAPCGPGMNCSLPQPACEQTAMQLLVGVPSGAAATRLAIKQVELLDDRGAVVGRLTARAPSRWDGQAYVAWDEAVTGTSGNLAVSYKLTAPDWDTLTNGPWNAASKKFALRVTVRISDKDRTVEKQKIVPVAPEPPVAT